MIFRNSLLVFIGVTLLSLGACQKRKARKTLEGTWDVVGSSGVFIDNCLFSGEIIELSDTLLGSITFTKKEVERDYVLMDGDPSCFAQAQRKDKNSWKVVDHDRLLVVAHVYNITIGSEEWSVIFGEDRIGEKVNDQDHAYLAKLDDFGDALYIEMERVE